MKVNCKKYSGMGSLGVWGGIGMAIILWAPWLHSEEPAQVKAQTIPIEDVAKTPEPGGEPSTAQAAPAGNASESAPGKPSDQPTSNDASPVDETQELNRKEWEARQKAAGLPRSHLEPDLADNQALASELRLLQEVWLDSLAEEHQFLLLERKERTGTPQGAAFLIPGLDQHGDWPSILRPISERLAEIGWFSFSLSMPYELREKPPERKLAAKPFDTYTPKKPAEAGGEEVKTTGEKSAADAPPKGADAAASQEGGAPASTESAPAAPEPPGAAVNTPNQVQIDLSAEAAKASATEPEAIDTPAKADAAPGKERVPVRDAVASRIDASFEHIKKSGYENIVFIAVGTGADSMLDFLARNKGKLPGRGFAMIWVAPEFSGNAPARLEEALEGFAAPLLDIYDSLDLSERDRAYERRLIARGQNVKRYFLVQMPLSGPSIEEKRRMLPFRVSAWLQKNAPGTKAKKVTR